MLVSTKHTHTHTHTQAAAVPWDIKDINLPKDTEEETKRSDARARFS